VMLELWQRTHVEDGTPLVTATEPA
jgi:hypothetical protein